jgi:hypothetical protein
MKTKKASTVKPRLQIYVRPTVLEDVQKLSQLSGLSMSAIAWLSFSEGYPKVRDNLVKGKKPNVQPTHGN